MSPTTTISASETSLSPLMTATVFCIADIPPPTAAPIFAPSTPALCESLCISFAVESAG